MSVLSMLTLLLTHPNEFRTLVQFWMFHDSKRDISNPKEYATSGWDRESMKKCWELLDKTSRSFSAVIKELDGDLARAICLFYIVLRGLDTIEDDMTIPDSIKQPLLRSFHEKTLTPGWTFDGNGPEEKDRIVLVEYDKVVEEVGRLEPGYREVIVDICHKMEIGMADYAHRASSSSSSSNTIYLSTIAEYDLYCHYVAGLVGEGLSRIWAASGKEAPYLGEMKELSNSMGLLLQKTNIIRDFREDADQGRFFWPREIWGRSEYIVAAGLPLTPSLEKGGRVEDLFQDRSEAGKRRALYVQSGMVLDALRHATDSLDYLRLLRNQTVFNFCAIPAVMAMATLELCFANGEVFERHVKIRKAVAAKLIMNSTNPRDVAYMFRDYARAIHKKSNPADPNFIRISVACAKIEQWAEHQFPSFVHLSSDPSGNSSSSSQTLDPSDARTRIAKLAQERDLQLARLRANGNGNGVGANGVGANGKAGGAGANANAGVDKELVLFFGGAVLLIVVMCLLVVGTVLYFAS